MSNPLLIIPVAIALLFPLGGLWLGYITPDDAEHVHGISQRNRVLLGITWALFILAALDAIAVVIFASMFVPA